MNRSDAIGHEEHRWAVQSLPWYVNGTLDESDVARLQAHLKVCAECQRDLHSEQALARRMAASPVVDYAPQASFSRLMRRLETDEQGPRFAPTRHPPQRGERRKRSRFAVAFALQAAVLAVSVGWLLLRPAEAPQYRTLSSSPSAVHAQLQVVFVDTATAADIRATLAEVGGHIVEGPSPAGVFLVSLEAQDASGAAMAYDVDAALTVLGEAPDVRYVAALPDRGSK